MNMNISSDSTVHLDGLSQLYDHRILLAVLLLLLYAFVMLSDGMVVYIVCSRRSLHWPMYVFVVAVLINSSLCSTAIYPKLLWDLVQGQRVVLLSRTACLCQAFVISSLASSSFMLLAAMATDRYLSICHPLRYPALMSPKVVATLLALCWLFPTCRVVGAIILASHLPVCYLRITRMYCDTYIFVSMSCGGTTTQISNAYGLFGATVTIYIPVSFVLFSYCRVLLVCLWRSRKFSGKALNTFLPHMLVFFNYSLTASFEFLHRRLMMGGTTVVTMSVVVVIVPSGFNPVVYGLKVAEIYKHVKILLRNQRRPKTQPTGN
ncbi:unnamed protein product [Knipowitschia caucasica]|uniref:Olfactory receptor n=1 Tax=Knipowitschia caucasica TaxID=637954 RepID=A0AAV2JWM5_KNICA